MIKYPWQIVSIKQEKGGVKKTLGVDARLSHPTGDEKSMPLEGHNGFSRFVLTLIEKNDKVTIYPKANIPADDAYYIIEKTKCAMAAMIKGAQEPAANAKSLAYTELFRAGNLKGKTPAQAVLENGEDMLIEQGKFLKENLKKFPANQKLIDGIKDAIRLFREGKLSAETANDTVDASVFVLYDIPMKPLRSQKLENGDCLVYGVKIVCDTTRNLPYAITINNSFAPINVTDKGTLNPVMAKAHDKTSVTMNLSEKDWFKIVHRMEVTLLNFEAHGWEAAAAMAEKASIENSKNAGLA